MEWLLAIPVSIFCAGYLYFGIRMQIEFNRYNNGRRQKGLPTLTKFGTWIPPMNKTKCEKKKEGEQSGNKSK